MKCTKSVVHSVNHTLNEAKQCAWCCDPEVQMKKCSGITVLSSLSSCFLFLFLFHFSFSLLHIIITNGRRDSPHRQPCGPQRQPGQLCRGARAQGHAAISAGLVLCVCVC